MRKFLFFAWSLLVTTALCAQSSADLMQQDLFSNYGGWKNLTAGYTRDTTDANPMKSEIAVCGNTVHVVWADMQSNYTAQPEGYDVWYRRSTDGGATWEDARSIYKRRTEGWSGYFNIMQAEGNNVHILVPDNWEGSSEDTGLPRLVYLRSTDGGASFTSKVMGTGPWEYWGIKYALIKAEGSNVVIAYHIDQPDNQDIVVCRSTDKGATFSTLTVTLPQAVHMLGDLQIKDGRWAIVASSQSWYNTLLDGRVYVVTGDMTSETASMSQLAPKLSNDGYYCQILDRQGYNGDELNHHPIMALTGSGTIHLLFSGATEIGKDDEGNDNVDFSHLLYIRSEDFGQTWSDIVTIPEATNNAHMLVAKGQNVYAIVGNDGKRWIAFSNDNGNTWKQNKRMCYGTSCGKWGCTNMDSPRAYDLVIDPNDPTGKTAWYIGAKWLALQTKDGFNSLSYSTRLDGDLRIGLPNERGSQMSPLLVIDGNGINHWLMREFVGINDLAGHNACQLFYRKETGEPAPSDKNMALHMSEKRLANNGDFPHSRVAIPLRETMPLDSAMSVAFWVRVDSLDTQTSLVYMRSNTEDAPYDDQFYTPTFSTPGFSIGLDSRIDGYDRKTGEFNAVRAQVKVYLHTDKSHDGVGTTLYSYSPYLHDVYMMWEPNLWHSVVFTWDSREPGQNMTLYLDGMPLATGSEYGKMEFGTNPIIIGNAVNFQNNQDWYMDDLQIWNRALSFDEVKQFAAHQPVSQNGCVVNYGFDGTLKDLSGNGNDALAQLDCHFVEYEGLRLPDPQMQITKDGEHVYLTDMTENGEAIYWYYGLPGYPAGTSGSGDAKRHDVIWLTYGYLNGNAYPIMITRGANACAPAYGSVRIGRGLSYAYPSSVGQAQGVRIRIVGAYDTYLNPNVRLHREGYDDIIGSWVSYAEGGAPQGHTFDETLRYASFDLADAAPGYWDAIVDEDTLKNGVYVEEYEKPQIWARHTCPSGILAGKNHKFSIVYGNNSNVDAYNVPLYFFVSSGPNKEGKTVSLGTRFPIKYLPDNLEPEWAQAVSSSIGSSTVFDAGDIDNGYEEMFGEMKCYAFLIPRIPAHSTKVREFSVMSGRDFDIVWSMGEPWGPLQYDENEEPVLYDDEIDEILNGKYRRFNNKQLDCIMRFLGWGFMDATVGNIPVVGCIYNGTKTVIMGITDDEDERWDNLFSNSLSTLVGCALESNPLGWGYRLTTLVGQAFNAAMMLQSANACAALGGDHTHVRVLSSYDPNEMIGPAGFGDEHFIKPGPQMDYTVTFENKPEATAPAHEVAVNDTLDASVYDFSSFSFGSFGWADTTLILEGGNIKEFTQYVTWEEKDMVVLVSGKFDEEKGIATWRFFSLNADGTEIDDPLKGFLVPNNANHEGEGFVTFHINHKAGLSGGAKIANEATIIFDYNDPIVTNRYSNTLDTDLPSSRALSATFNDQGKIVVTWEADDATAGAGTIDLYQSVNDGEFEWIGRFAASKLSAEIPCEDPGKTYSFATVAIDRVGWREQKAETDLTPETVCKFGEGIDVPNSSQKTVNAIKKLKNGALYILLPSGRTYNATGAEIK